MDFREMKIILKRGKGIIRGKNGFWRDENCSNGMEGDG